MYSSSSSSSNSSNSKNKKRAVVENPFRKRKLTFWIRYGIAGCGCGLILTWCLFGGSSSNSSSGIRDFLVADRAASSSRSSVHDPSHLLRKPVMISLSGVVNNDDENENENENENSKHDDNADDKSVSRSSDEDEDKVDQGNRMYDPDDDIEQESDGKPFVKQDDDYREEEEDEFPSMGQNEFLDWIRFYYNELKFLPESSATADADAASKLTKSLLTESLELGCEYIARNQKAETGNFNYQYDFVTHTLDDDDSPVRQAGALWGITLCFQSLPDNASYRNAVERGIAFFRGHTVDGPAEGSRMVVYPGFENESQSGVNALYGLALVDCLATIREHPDAAAAIAIVPRELETELDGILRFLVYLQQDNGHFAEAYDREEEEKSEDSSPYYDGETMLCLVKAARHLGDDHRDLVPLIERTAPVLAKAYTVDAWREDGPDSSLTKGFYQWSSMVFQEYYFAEWENYEYFGDCLLVLAHWIIHTHEILERQLNTGYAFEGIVSAYNVARVRGHTEALADLGYAIDEGLYKLTGWQVGGPLAHTNSFLVSHPTDERIAIGGIMNARDEAPLRIDTTQHQMHAVMMALETLFAEAIR